MKSLFASVLWTLLNVEFTRAAFYGVKWNKRLGEFVPISGLSSYEDERRRNAVQMQQQESSNFHGQPVNLTYYEDFGFFQFHDNNTRVTGVCGDIYTLLSKFLNFTLVLSNSGKMTLGISFPNGTYSGIMEYARLNQTDVIPKVPVYTTRINAVTFAPVFWMNSQRIFARGLWKRNYAWMFTLFPVEIWSLICFTIVILSIVSLGTERVLIRHRRRQLRSRSVPEHLYCVVSTMFNQVNGKDSVASGSRILALTISIFCFLILIGYNSHLIYSMTEEIFDAPFHDLTTLFKNTEFRIVVLEGSTAHNCFTSPYTYPIFKLIFKAKRVKVVPDVEELYRHVCLNPHKYVMLDAVDTMAARKNTACSLIPVGAEYFLIPVASGISRRLKNKKILDIGILKLHEFGIIDAIKKRYMLRPKRDVGRRVSDSLAIDMGRVSVVFGILCFGIFASIVICVAENMIFTFKKRKTMESLIQRLPTIHQPLFDRIVHSRKSK